MKYIIITFSCITLIFQDVNAQINSPSSPINISLNSVRIGRYGFLTVNESDVQFRLWTQDQVSENTSYVLLHIGYLKNVTNLNCTDQYVFIIHGYLSSADTNWYKQMTTEYLKKGDYCVIQVDWSKKAIAAYPLAARYTKSVAGIVGKLIIDLQLTWNVSVSRIHLVGHSLGAHISGFTGAFVTKYLKAKIGRITGLDPAGPLFTLARLKNRLNKKNAKFVDIIHTDRGKFGYPVNCGHADFYPDNGMAPQPLCVTFNMINEAMGCSHACSTIYFITSINSNKFIGIKCINYLYYLLDYCDYLDEEPLAIMGDGCSPNARGSYYLSVAAKPPYTDDDNTGTDNSISGDF